MTSPAPRETLTRAEALELAIKALKLFPINVYNDLYADVVGHETYAGTVQCAAQNHLIPPEWVADGCLYPAKAVTCADFLAVLMPGAAGRRPLAEPVPVPDAVPPYARRAAGQAVAEQLTAAEAPERAPCAAALQQPSAAACIFKGGSIHEIPTQAAASRCRVKPGRRS